MIGFFDSGVGGLSILQEVERLMPEISTVYFADTENFPYGTKTEDEVRNISVTAAERLVVHKPEVIVVACNTASTVALDHLRQKFPTIHFIGVVPAIKPAATMSLKKKIAVLATARTISSPAYGILKQEFTDGVTVLDQACAGWVELVEAGHIDDSEADVAIRDVIEPLARQGVDAYVLGCTHYPFLRSLIQHYAGNAASVLDSGEAVAKQLERVLFEKPADEGARREVFITSGDQVVFQKLASRLLRRQVIVD